MPIPKILKHNVKIVLKMLICLAMSEKIPTFASVLETTSINN